jgi:hypothetical protein
MVDERSTIYPTRLLDLQSFEEGCSDIRLIETPVSGSLYATLSHCWGANPDTRYQAAKSTLRDLVDRIRYTDLPSTYCDAISVCRSLGVRYLWIDSLCIIQDSKEDWARESANMAYIYSNSHLTISADWSPNSEGGCYKVNRLPQGIRINSGTAIHVTSVLSDGKRSLSILSKILSSYPSRTRLYSLGWSGLGLPGEVFISAQPPFHTKPALLGMQARICW